MSPSGRWRLEIKGYPHPEPGYWSYSQGKVFRAVSDEVVAEVRRNYGSFPSYWLEDHPTGKDYLICGTNYQGQTVVCLNTGEVAHWIPEAARHGWGFIIVAYNPNPDKTLLAVGGCIWASNYETRIYDISQPMKLPWPELYTTELDTFVAWRDNTHCEISGKIEVYKKPGSRLDGLTYQQIYNIGVDDEEMDGMEEKTERRTLVWDPSSPPW